MHRLHTAPGTWQSLGLWATARTQRQHFPNGEESELGQEVFKKKVREELYFPCRVDFGEMNNGLYYHLSPKQIQKNIREKPACPPAPHQGTPPKFPYPTSKCRNAPGLRERLPWGTGTWPGSVVFLSLCPLFFCQHCTQRALSIPNSLRFDPELGLHYSTSPRSLSTASFYSLGR